MRKRNDTLYISERLNVRKFTEMAIDQIQRDDHFGYLEVSKFIRSDAVAVRINRLMVDFVACLEGTA